MSQENELPLHIAIIMDGNRRWAKKRNIDVRFGHKKGAETLENIEHYIQQPGYRACVLFPGEQAQALRAYQDNQQPLLLIVPDGTWRKARKILHCNPLLAALPRVTLAPGLSSRYRLRKAPDAQALATVEAVTYALTVLEPELDFSPLLRPFDALIEGQITAMGAEVYQRNHVDL